MDQEKDVAGFTEPDRLKLQVQLCMISGDVSREWLDVILRILSAEMRAERHVHQTCVDTQKLVEEFAAASKHRPSKTIPMTKPSSLTSTFVQHVNWLFCQTQQRRRAASRALAAIASERLLDDLSDCIKANHERAQTLRREIRRAKRLGAATYTACNNYAQNSTIDVEELTDEDCPFRFFRLSLVSFEKVVACAETASGEPEWGSDIEVFFQKLSHWRWQDRVSLLDAWENRVERMQDGVVKGVNYRIGLKRIARLIERYGLSPHLEEYLDTTSAGLREDLVFGLSRKRGDFARNREKTSQLVRSLFYDQPEQICVNILACVPAFAAYAPSVRIAVETVLSLNAIDGQLLFDEDVKVAFELDSNPESVARIINSFRSIDIATPANHILKTVSDPAMRNTVRWFVLHQRKRQLRDIATAITSVHAVGMKVPAIEDQDNDNAWIHRYPKTLHDALEELNRRTSDASEKADHILRRDFPNEQTLREDIRKMEQKLQDPSLSQITKENLQQCLVAKRKRKIIQREIGPKRIENLIDKIYERACHEVRETFVTRCHETVRKGFRKYSRHAPLSPRLFEPPYDQLIAGVFDQANPTARTAGIQLLIHADQEQKNQTPLSTENEIFVEKIKSSGINMEPWLCSPITSIVGTSGRSFELGFETDSLELLLMGFHFDTCLSPDSFHFDTAIANAIDVNKQVLFCRDGDGNVVGRCLFALTNDGKIKTFRRYAHDSELNFDQIVDQFAQNLAEKMGTSLTSHGTVKPLVANNWYDDGPVKGGLTFFEDRLGLSELIQKATSESILSLLVEKLGSRDTLRDGLEAVLGDKLLEGRGELVGVLIDEFAFEKETHFVDRMRLAVLAHRNGDTELACKIVRSINHRDLPRRLKSCVCRICPDIHDVGTEREVLDLLVDFDPQIARRFLKLTRAYNVKRDDQETRGNRRRALEKIYRTLGRPDLARRFEERSSR